MDLIAPFGGIDGCKSAYRSRTNDNNLLHAEWLRDVKKVPAVRSQDCQVAPNLGKLGKFGSFKSMMRFEFDITLEPWQEWHVPLRAQRSQPNDADISKIQSESLARPEQPITSRYFKYS